MAQVYIETYGCQMNVADSETVSSILQKAGHSVALTPQEADAILINTCAVREHAEERIFGRVGELAQYKHVRPDIIIGVLGCMAQHLKDDLLKRSRWVDIVAGPDSYRRLPEMLEAARTERISDVRLDHQEIYDGVFPARKDGISAWVTVQRGCNKCCTFCIVPAVRGRERCVPMEDIVHQVSQLTEDGVREVTLLGQTVNSYHDGVNDFADLLSQLALLPLLKRIRFTSPYPTDFTDKLIETMATEDKVAKHIHLPLQSASNKVLAKAKRRYTIEEFDDILTRVRRAVPNMAVSTDIIVGFHDEGEPEFQETMDYVSKARFDFAFMFKYSRRSQTAAWRWDETIDEKTKNDRLRQLIDLQESISREIQQSCLGTTATVLVEGESKKLNGQMFGRTTEFRQVVFDADDVRPGDLVEVTIRQATGHTLVGELVPTLTGALR